MNGASSPSPSPSARRAPFTARLIQNPLVWAAVMGVLFGVPVYRSMTRRLTASPPILGGLPAFTLTDQRGQPFGSRELAGKVWVADFIFTHCPGACPKMTMRMAALQRAVPDPDVHFVSFSVDPERDTPAVLKQYAQGFDADPKRWHFLTGRKDDVFQAARGMKLTAEPAGVLGPEIAHAEKFLLVDGQGRVRGAYDSKDEDDMKRLAADAASLANQQAGRLF